MLKICEASGVGGRFIAETLLVGTLWKFNHPKRSLSDLCATDSKAGLFVDWSKPAIALL